MNSSYRSIWNESLNAWVAVSELAVARGKPNAGGRRRLGRTRRGIFHFSGLGAAVAMLALGAPTQGQAVELTHDTSCVGGASALVYRTNPGPTTAPGGNTGTYGILGGCSAVASGLGHTVLGTFANGGAFTGVTAIGIQAQAAANFATALGDEALASGIASTALGTGSIASGKSSISLGGGGASILSVANSTTATGNGAIAIGVNDTKGAQSLADNGVAVGAQSTVATGATSGVAVGRGATTLAASGVAMGDGATSGATGQNVAIGSGGTIANASTAAGGAVAIGLGQKATGNGAVAIGDPNIVNGTGAVAVGADNTAAGDAAGAVAADGAVAIGNANTAIGQGNIAIGSASNATTTGSLAMGVGANATNTNAIALGTGAAAAQAGAVALGSGSATAAAVATPSTTIAGTTYNFAGIAPTSTVSVGAAGAERTITNVAAGQISATSTDAINGSQLFASNQAISSAITATSDKWIIGSPTTYVAPASTGTPQLISCLQPNRRVVVEVSAAQ